MKKTKIAIESKLGVEYVADTISSCEQNGIQCIVDDNSGKILFYDPNGRKFADSKMLSNADYSIFDLLRDKKEYGNIMRDCSGDEFQKFAMEWNALQKKDEGDDVFKTKKCEMIRMDLKNESYDDNRDWSANEDEVEIQWMIDDKDFGIVSGSNESFVIDLDLVDSFEELVYQVTKAIEEEYDGMTFDYDDEWIFVDEDKQLKRFGYNMNENNEDGEENLSVEDIPDEMSLEEGMELYKKLDDAYYGRKMNYYQFRELNEKMKSAVVKGLLKGSSIEKLAKEWFKDYGTANGWGWKTSFEYGIADKLHDLHKKKHPDEHKKLPQKENWRGWHEDNCSCGFCSSSDSSD